MAEESELTDDQKAAADAGKSGKGEGETSDKVVQKGKKTAREIQLEKEIAGVQDKNSALELQVADLSKLVEGAKRAPNPANKEESLLDVLNRFMGLAD